MWTIFKKRIIKLFQSPLIAYIVIGIFVVVLGLLMWFFLISVYYILIMPLWTNFFCRLFFSVCDSCIKTWSFSEEIHTGIAGKPHWQNPFQNQKLLFGKFFACLSMVMILSYSILVYFYSVYQLGTPIGNIIDTGAVPGSYIGLLFLASALVSIGIFCSAIAKNQVSAFDCSTDRICHVLWILFCQQTAGVCGRVDDLISTEWNGISL